MDVLKNKNYLNYDYTCRYKTVPCYYHTKDEKYIYGVGSNISKDLSYTLHQVTPSDTLDYLALKYYNNPTYWWVLCFFNDIQDAFINLYEAGYRNLKIPNISAIKFGEER